jgi:hypothetical protein
MRMKKILPFAIIVAILVAVAFYFNANVDSSSTSQKAQTDFAIPDTASIGKIFIADTKGKTITLDRTSGVWIVNDLYPAREDAADLLLKTFRNVYVQRPVAKEGQEQVNKVMAAAAKKVEIYDREGNWIKTWYVGHGTMDKKGTYMLLETPEGGKSSAPFIMDMRGFLGMLDTRFFTNLAEWRSTRILHYPDLQLKEVDVQYPDQPEASFRITYGGGNDIRLFDGTGGTEIAQFDTSLVKDYLLNFKLASFENFNNLLSPAQEDSVKTLTPYQIIKVTDSRQERTLRLWFRAAPEGQTEMDGETLSEIDRERIYAMVDDGELAFAQRFVWENFRAPLQAFLLK